MCVSPSSRGNGALPVTPGYRRRPTSPTSGPGGAVLGSTEHGKQGPKTAAVTTPSTRSTTATQQTQIKANESAPVKVNGPAERGWYGGKGGGSVCINFPSRTAEKVNLPFLLLRCFAASSDFFVVRERILWGIFGCLFLLIISRSLLLCFVVVRLRGLPFPLNSTRFGSSVRLW